MVLLTENEAVDILKKSGGLYECPKDLLGKRIGPLVGLTGRDEKGRQFVAEKYINFSRIGANDLRKIALMLKKGLGHHNLNINIICPVPEGGKKLASIISSILFKFFLNVEKRLDKSKKEGEREDSSFVLGEGLVSGDNVLIVEDVVNSFASVNKIAKLILERGGIVAGIVAFLNRSEHVDCKYSISSTNSVPVISLWREIIPKYKQDDPYVSDDVKKGNVVWNPKKHWDKLVPEKS